MTLEVRDGTLAVTPFKTLDEITPRDRSESGGKAFNCARLRQAGFPVPDGIVVPASATDEDITRLRQHPWFTRANGRASPSGEPDLRFAVRSSGLDEDSEGHSFAGVHETRLNVDIDGLREAVDACRRSSGTEQAIAYRRTQQLAGGSRPIAVLIQRMVAAVTAGVAFTVNPVTGANEIVINASWGLGDALVGGTVEPDELTVRKSDCLVTSSRLGAKGRDDRGTAALTPAQSTELAGLLLRIEQHYGAPQDVEWCHDGGQFWIVQSRPVTAARTAAREDIEWTRANLAEVFPDQMSPQALTAYTDLLNEAERLFMGKLLAPYDELGPMVKVFHGRAYFNLSQLRRVCALTGSAAADFMRSMGHNEKIQPADEIAGWPPWRELLPILPAFLRVAVKQLRAPHLFARHQRRTSAVIARLSGADPRALSDADLWAVVEWWRRLAPAYAEIVLVLASVMVHEVALKKICDQVGFPYDRLVLPQLAAGERSVSTQQAIDLLALADVARREPAAARYLHESAGAYEDYRAAVRGTLFLERFDRFLDRYGHRGPYESDWALPRYREAPASLLFAIRSHLGAEAPVDFDALAARQAREADEAWHAFEARLGRWQRLTLLPRVRAIVRRLKWQYVHREECRSDLTRVVAHLRAWHLVLADRFVARGWLDRPNDYFLLHLDEVGEAIHDPAAARRLRDIARSRAADLHTERELNMPFLMRESELASLLGSAEVTADGDRAPLTGLCVSPGCVEGEVVVMRDPSEFARMKRGAILVAPATDPAWTPLFTLAAGVIVEIGGMLSHASTIAREYGLPALANVKHATKVLEDGERIRLDATGGRVYRTVSR